LCSPANTPCSSTLPLNPPPLLPLQYSTPELLCEFFRSFKDEHGNAKYVDALQAISNGDKVLDVHLDDIDIFFQDHGEFSSRIQHNTLRYQGLAAVASDRCMPPPNIESSTNASVFDIYTQTRKDLIQAARDQGASVSSVPLQLLQNHVVHFLPKIPSGRALAQAVPLRSVGAESIGSLVTIRGLVIKVSDVQPAVEVQTYLCSECSYESYQTIDLAQSYTPLLQCPSPQCVQNQSKGDLRIQLRSSKLVSKQTIILQEVQQEVPVGGVARTLRVVASSADLVGLAKPGALVTVSGIFLPEQFSGFKGVRAGLVTEQYLLAKMISTSKKNYSDVVITEAVNDHLVKLSERDDIYQLLTNCISPEIYGHADTKRALLLSMIGGVTRTMPDGMKIRGDINCMLVGDPGMAKSQIIKYVHGLAPRAVYTTGKGASGVGLTASVNRDPKSGEISLEGGALVLADMGICCIDEFDKMTEEDRTAIHEVMEQQTVSISKAGIITSLNARTTVIAAANPAYGRYNPRRSLSENMNMPPALLSRFDLVFVLLDVPQEDRDLELARHIVFVHKHGRPPTIGQLAGNTNQTSPQDVGLDNDVFRAYIAKAKQFSPVIPAHVMKFISTSYVNLRQTSNESDLVIDPNNTTSNSRERFCTARQLLGIIRISQALAKLHFRSVVLKEDVEESMRLLDASKAAISSDSGKASASVYADNLKSGGPSGRIWNKVKNLVLTERTRRFQKEALAESLQMGGSFSAEEFDNFILDYTALDIIEVSRDDRWVLIKE
jgi:DNA replication licensing factor MCM7